LNSLAVRWAPTYVIKEAGFGLKLFIAKYNGIKYVVDPQINLERLYLIDVSDLSSTNQNVILLYINWSPNYPTSDLPYTDAGCLMLSKIYIRNIHIYI
jgi:hypothetical protein